MRLLFDDVKKHIGFMNVSMYTHTQTVPYKRLYVYVGVQDTCHWYTPMSKYNSNYKLWNCYMVSRSLTVVL